MPLFVNSRIRYLIASVNGGLQPLDYRVLWMEPGVDDVYAIQLTEVRSTLPRATKSRTRMPIKLSRRILEDDLESGEAEIVDVEDDPDIVVFPEHLLTAKQRAHRDRRYERLKPLITSGRKQYEVESRTKILAEIEGSHDNHYGLAVDWWIGGQQINALITGHALRSIRRYRGRSFTAEKRLGRKNPDGNEVIVTEDIGARMVRAYQQYCVKDKMTIWEAYARFCHDQYAYKHTLPDGNVVRKLPARNTMPTYRQFEYCIKRHFSPQQMAANVVGEAEYAKNHRGVVGDARARVMGPGTCYIIDWTTLDILLVHPNGASVIGSPILYIVVDAFSGLITGSNLAMGASDEAFMMALYNCARDKTELYIRGNEVPSKTKSFGCLLPASLYCDKGPEFTSRLSDRLLAPHQGIGLSFTETIANEATGRPDIGLKGIVESLIGLLKKHLRRKGLGGANRRIHQRYDTAVKKAQYTLNFMEKAVSSIIDTYNREHVIDNYPVTPDMAADQIKPNPLILWEWGIVKRPGHLRRISDVDLRRSLLPRATASITREGIRYGKLMYSSDVAILEGWFDQGLTRRAQPVEILYEPRTAAYIYVWRGLRLIKCYLREQLTVYGSMPMNAAQDWGKENQKAKNTARLDTQQSLINDEEKLKPDRREATALHISKAKGLSASKRRENLAENRLNAMNIYQRGADWGDLATEGSGHNPEPMKVRSNHIPPAPLSDEMSEVIDEELANDGEANRESESLE